VIYVLEYQDYDNSYIEKVLEGPAKPGFEALSEKFDKALGIPEPPAWNTWTGAGVWEEILKDNKERRKAWKAERNRLVSGRYGSVERYPGVPDWSAYWDALIQRLCDEHRYKTHEFEVHDTNLT
jgi:hypothetical protein